MSSEPGAPLAGGIPLSVPSLDAREWEYVKECLDSGWVSSAGPFVDRFERELSARLGGGAAVATVTGTAALHVALLVAGVQSGDEVVVSTLSFIAPANAVRYAGAVPVFVDAEPSYWQMDPAALRTFLEEECETAGGALRNRRTGRRVSAVLPVHVLGHPVDMDPVLDAARRFGLAVVEDATESLGARYKGRPVGRLGDVACFSFNGNKVVTSGGGGMIVTDRADWARRARYLTTQAKDDPVEYVHRETGFNYRLTNLQAALGCAQLERLDAKIAAKRRIAATYAQAFAERPGLTGMKTAAWAESIAWLYTVLVGDEAGTDRRSLLAALQAQGVQTRPLWQPLHRSPAFADLPRRPCPVAERIHSAALSLPSSVGLTETDQERVIDAVLSSTRGRAAAEAR